MWNHGKKGLPQTWNGNVQQYLFDNGWCKANTTTKSFSARGMASKTKSEKISVDRRSIYDGGIFHLTSNRALTAIWSISFYNHNNLSSATLKHFVASYWMCTKPIWIWMRREINVEKQLLHQTKCQSKTNYKKKTLQWRQISISAICVSSSNR